MVQKGSCCLSTTSKWFMMKQWNLQCDIYMVLAKKVYCAGNIFNGKHQKLPDRS
jgi:hypothetical protein